MIITDEMIADFKTGFHGSTLSEEQVKRGLGKVFGNRGLFDSAAPMADGGDMPMTAAEEVLAWLLIEKIGVPDDVGYSPNQAQEIIVRRLDLARELEEIDAMLAEGQGDDEGHPIMPEFTKGMTTYAKVEACLHLLESRRDALHPSPVSKVLGIKFPLPSWQEQAAFEEWANAHRYEMDQHPLHYLFSDKQTNAARQGWKAALAFVRQLQDEAQPPQPNRHLSVMEANDLGIEWTPPAPAQREVGSDD